MSTRRFTLNFPSCRECGLKPCHIEGKRIHDYCSPACAQRVRERLPSPIQLSVTHGPGKQTQSLPGFSIGSSHSSPSSPVTPNKLCAYCRSKRTHTGRDGYQYEFCSKECGRAFEAAKRQTFIVADSPNTNNILCKACKTRPVYVEPDGRSHPFCGRTCARNYRSAKAAHNHGGNELLFYNKGEPFYEFTNFSPHSISYKGKIYPTSEHLFQSFKFEYEPDLAENIRRQPTPRDAFQAARSLDAHKRHDWDRVKIGKMTEILRLKFTQHEDLKNLLLSTGDAELVENSPVDSFWGNGGINGNGYNQLGKTLMQVRDELRTKAK